ncbi:succinyl-diaminopimelate desuccinylase [Rhizobiales bacterium GAS188]|nr:succinyl-diaminopimelate desuccinylase [Rhizobiales bacterium GAS188]
MAPIAARIASDDARFEAALSSIEQDVGAALDDLSRMVAVDTSFPPGAGYGAFADVLEGLLRPMDFACTRVAVPEALWRIPGGPAHGERINLVARQASDRPVCGLYFHTDTVPAATDWKRSPFSLTREGDKLYGLGAADMKGSIAAALLALRAARRCGVALAYDPTLLFCTDEEGGLYPGIRHLAEQGLLEGHILNFNGGAVPRIWAGCFGSFNLLIRLHGRAAHAGDLGRGLNAVEAALPLMNALASLKPRIAERRSALPPPPHLEGRPLTASLTIAAAHGGSTGSAIPALFELLVNRRYPPEESFDAALAEIEEVVRNAAQSAGLRPEMHIVGHLAPVTDPTGPHWPRWQAALSLGFGYTAEEFRAWGSSTASDFGWVQKTGMREFLLGGLGRPDRNVHAAEEHTTVTDIVALAKSILAYLAADFRKDIIPEADRSAS